MQSTNPGDLESQDWQGLVFSTAPSVFPANTRWAGYLLVAVIAAHAVLIAYLFSWRSLTRQHTEMPREALEITYIERQENPGPAEKPVSPGGKDRDAENPRARLPDNYRHVPAPENSAPDIADTSLRLSIIEDEWQPVTAVAPANPLKRKTVAIAGRAEPFMEGIKLRDRLTPQQKLAMVGKLFGAVEYDACGEARSRMARRAGGNENDIEADLRSIELHCRP